MADAAPKRNMLNVVTDGWQNIITGLGTSRDKREGGRLRKGGGNANRQEEWDEFFHSDDIAATIAELPAREALREWITIRTDDTSGDDDDDVEPRVNLAKSVMQKLEDLGAQRQFFQAKVWANVHGGSLMFLGVDDGSGDDPELLKTPLNDATLQSVDFLKVFTRWDVEIGSIDMDPSSQNFGGVLLYELRPRGLRGDMPTRPLQVHHSRVIRFDGPLTSPERIRRNGGWSDSVYQKIEQVLRDYGVAWASIAHILQDFAQGVFKMNGLRDALVSDNDGLVINRVATMDLCRGVSRIIPIDKDDEDFIRVQTPVSGVPELMDRFALRIAAAARMPATLLFGMSPAGLQATGASDIRLFYDSIRSGQETVLRPQIERVVELILRSADGPGGGVEPENWSVEFNPLWQLTEMEQATLRKTQAETDAVYLGQGVLSENEVAMSRFGGDRYSPETVLDMDEREESEAMGKEMEAARMKALEAAAAAQPIPPQPPQPGDQPPQPPPPAAEPEPEDEPPAAA